MREIVAFKGTKDGIELTMDKSATFDEILHASITKFMQTRDFFKNSQVSICFRGKDLTDVQKAILQTKIWDLFGEETKVDFAIEEEKEEEPPAPVENEKSVRFHRGTLRNGQRLECMGNMIVIGDANPGSEIAAAGNVIVLGSLKGIVHAGFRGNRDAIVIALDMQPTQLRIADVITRPPDDDVRDVIAPEIAFLNGNEIYIERLTRDGHNINALFGE